MTTWSVRSMSWWSSPLPLTAALPTLSKEQTSDQAPPGRTAGTCRLALCVRARLGQAGAPDQLPLPRIDDRSHDPAHADDAPYRRWTGVLALADATSIG